MTTRDKTPQVVALGAASTPGAREVVAVPGADAALIALDLPEGLKGQNREDVARRQLRDSFGIDPQAVDIRPFHGPAEAGGWQRLMVVDAALIEDWRARSAGAQAVLPDYLTLPTAEGLWTVGPGAAADSIALRLGPGDGFAAATALAPVLLARALAEAKAAGAAAPRALLRLGDALPEIEAVAAAHGLEVITQDAQARALAGGELAFDLRRDPQLARARLAGRVLPWRWPVLLGLVAAGVWAAAQMVVTERITQETRSLRAQTTALVQERFTGGAPVLDVRAQVAQALRTAQSTAAGRDARPDPLALFGQAAVVLAQTRAQTQGARYTSADGLQVVADLGDFAAVEALLTQLAAAGLAVELVETATREGGVRATFDLGPGAGPAPGEAGQ